MKLLNFFVLTRFSKVIQNIKISNGHQNIKLTDFNNSCKFSEQIVQIMLEFQC